MGDVEWTQVLLFGLVALAVFGLGLGMLSLLFGAGFGIMGAGGVGRAGLLATIMNLSFACLLPLGVLALLAVGGVWLARRVGSGAHEPDINCPGCGQPVQRGWKTCPSCGEDLQDERE
jgi:hypothetical protein